MFVVRNQLPDFSGGMTGLSLLLFLILNLRPLCNAGYGVASFNIL